MERNRNNVFAGILGIVALSVVICSPFIVEAHNSNATWDMSNYWWRDDDGSESSASGYGAGDTAINTSITGVSVGTTLRLRIGLVKDNNGDLNLSTTPILDFQSGSVACTVTTGWTQVPTETSCGSTAICQASSANVTDGGTTSYLFTGTGSTDVGGDVVETDGSANAATYGTGTNTDIAEWEWVLDTTNASESTTYTLRVSKGSSGTNYGTYTNCAQVTIAAAATAPTVTTNAATGITENSATINGEITATGGENATSRGFAWGITTNLSGGDTSTTTESGSFGIGTFNSSLTSLTPGGQYYFRAYATNSAGTGYGSIASFRTSLGQPRALLLGTVLLLSGTLIIF